jgi:hypothetical protein
VIESIIAELDVEIARLQKVRALLVNDKPKRGLLPKATSVSPVQPAVRKRRAVSPEAKERMRQGQLKRWAAAKKTTKATARKASHWEERSRQATRR